MTRHLISLEDLSDDDLYAMAARAAEHGAGRPAGHRPLDGTVVGIYFRKTSTRTRTAFSVGALRLGAGIVAYGPDDLQTNTGRPPRTPGRCSPGCSTCSSRAPPASRRNCAAGPGSAACRW